MNACESYLPPSLSGQGVPWDLLAERYEDLKQREDEQRRRSASDRPPDPERTKVILFNARRNRMMSDAKGICGGALASIDGRSDEAPWVYALTGVSGERVFVCEHCATHHIEFGFRITWANYHEEHRDCELPKGVSEWEWLRR